MPVVLDDSTAAIGAIQSALLTEAQFQAQFGSGWILADGRSVLGSKYETITGRSSIPDLRGVVLRGKNNGRNDGGQNPDLVVTGTITSGSKNIVILDADRTVSERDICVGQRVSSTAAGIPVGAKVESVTRTPNAGNLSNSGYTITVVLTAAATASGSRSITFSGELDFGVYQPDQNQYHQHLPVDPAVNTIQSFGASSGTNWYVDSYGGVGNGDKNTGPAGGLEARMKNVTVNHFIRIN